MPLAAQDLSTIPSLSNLRFDAVRGLDLTWMRRSRAHAIDLTLEDCGPIATLTDTRGAITRLTLIGTTQIQDGQLRTLKEAGVTRARYPMRPHYDSRPWRR